VEPAANEADSSAHAAPRKNEKAVAVHNFKTLIVGDGAIGKTCLTSRFTNNSISWDSDPEYEPTTFQNFIIEWEPGNPVVGEELGTSTLGLEFWDTAGQEAFAQLRKLSYPGAGIVLVGYSCVSKISLKNVANKWMEELNSVLLATEGTPWTILVGTKKDMRSLPGQEVVSLEEGQAMAKKINAIAHVETSAKMEDLEASGVNEMLRLITKYALMKIRGVSRPNWIAPGAAPAAKVSVPLPAAKPPVQVRQFKTVIVGDGAIGKTCMTSRFTDNVIDWNTDPEYEPTTFANFVLDWQPNDSVIADVLQGSSVEVEFWDTAGQEAFSQLRQLSYPGSGLFILGYSCVSATSLSNIKEKWLPEVEGVVLSNDGTPWTVLVGAKKDLKHLADFKANAVSKAEGEAMAKAINACAFVETSAKMADMEQSGINELRRTMCALALMKQRGEPRPDWACPNSQSSASAKPKAAAAAEPLPVELERNLNEIKQKVQSAWQEVFDSNSGRNYYYNSQTGATSWEKPAELQPAPAAAAPAAAPANPWQEIVDPSSGKPYYYNATTGETTWTKPAAMKTSVWQEIKDPASGRFYYWNPQTKETVWNKPADF